MQPVKSCDPTATVANECGSNPTHYTRYCEKSTTGGVCNAGVCAD